MAKTSFERMAKECGVFVKEYHTDNGVYTSAAFQQTLQDEGQAIRFSGVGAKWQNLPAKNSIKILVNKQGKNSDDPCCLALARTG
jgi:hypothetical protein